MHTDYHQACQEAEHIHARLSQWDATCGAYAPEFADWFMGSQQDFSAACQTIAALNTEGDYATHAADAVLDFDDGKQSKNPDMANLIDRIAHKSLADFAHTNCPCCACAQERQ